MERFVTIATCQTRDGATTVCPMDLRVDNLGGWALVGSGDGRKVERFGDRVIERPAPQAIWPGRFREEKRPDARFHRGQDGQGTWKRSASGMPEAWPATLSGFPFEVRLTGFGNVGLFPEHAAHWSWMSDKIKEAGPIEVLNLFGYTGAASIFCATKGARVTHVDAAKTVNAWAMVNASRCSVPAGAIRYLADDALKFVRREERRGRRYHGIIIDPPTFGRGPKGEVWKVENDFVKLMEVCRSICHRDAAFVLVTSHSPGITPAVLRALLSEFSGPIESGEMLLCGGGPDLPAGAYARWSPRQGR